MRRIVQALGMLAIVGGLCHAWGASLLAADKPAVGVTDPGALFDKLDTDHSGVLTTDKIPADKRTLFERLLRLAGKPADGQLNRAEFVAQLKSITEPPANGVVTPGSAGSGGSTSSTSPAGAGTAKSVTSSANDAKKQPDPAKTFDRFDKNHTGKLTISDVPEERQNLFKRLLREAGKPPGSSLTKDEFIKAFEAVLAKRASAMPATAKSTEAGKSPASANAGNTGEGFDVDKMVERLMKLSTRPDGKLTKSDLPERMQSRFEKIDTNQDGLIDETELRTWLTKAKRQLAAARALGAAIPGASNASKSDPASGEAAKSDSAKTGSGASNN